MSDKATEEDFQALWRVTVKGLISALENPKNDRPTASLLNVARLFLQDQGIIANANERGDPQSLIGMLKALDEEDAADDEAT